MHGSVSPGFVSPIHHVLRSNRNDMPLFRVPHMVQNKSSDNQIGTRLETAPSLSQISKCRIALRSLRKCINAYVWQLLSPSHSVLSLANCSKVLDSKYSSNVTHYFSLTTLSQPICHSPVSTQSLHLTSRLDFPHFISPSQSHPICVPPLLSYLSSSSPRLHPLSQLQYREAFLKSQVK